MTMNADAIDATIEALISAGKLHPDADAARISTARSLASACDASPENASLWREYRAAEQTLHEPRGSHSDEAAEVVAAMRAPVRDKKNTRAPHTRTASSRGG